MYHVGASATVKGQVFNYIGSSLMSPHSAFLRWRQQRCQLVRHITEYEASCGRNESTPPYSGSLDPGFRRAYRARAHMCSPQDGQWSGKEIPRGPGSKARDTAHSSKQPGFKRRKTGKECGYESRKACCKDSGRFASRNFNYRDDRGLSERPHTPGLVCMFRWLKLCAPGVRPSMFGVLSAGAPAVSALPGACLDFTSQQHTLHPNPPPNVANPGCFRVRLGAALVKRHR